MSIRVAAASSKIHSQSDEATKQRSKPTLSHFGSPCQLGLGRFDPYKPNSMRRLTVKLPPPPLSLSKGSSRTATTTDNLPASTTRGDAPRLRIWRYRLGQRRCIPRRRRWRFFSFKRDNKDKQGVPDQVATSETTPRISNSRRLNLQDTCPERQRVWILAVLEAIQSQRRSFFSSYDEYDSFFTSSESWSEDSDNSVIDGPRPSILPMDDTFDDDASIISVVEHMFLQSFCTSGERNQDAYICG